MIKTTLNGPLCPGKDHFLKNAKDLSHAMFRRLVARRSRSIVPGHDGTVPETEGERRALESELKMTLEKINEEADFLPVSFLSDGALCAEAICRVVVPGESGGYSLGTGFLIAPGLLMTNHHVIETESQGQEGMAEFLYEEGESPIAVSLHPERFFMTEASLDFTIIACDGHGIEHISPIPLSRNPAVVTRYERVNIIQHPRGRRKEIAIHDNRVDRVQDKVILYETDTEPGSSGSAVFNNAWQLVALHHAGYARPGQRALNEGIRISAIVDYVVQQLGGQERLPHGEITEALLSHINPYTPYLGFFGTVGLGLSEQEVQVNDFKGTPDFADIGCWNIEHFNNHVSNKRVEDIADVVEQLSLDVFGLTEVEGGAMDRLVDALSDRGSRCDYVLRDENGSQDLAVLYDTDTTEVARATEIADRNKALLEARTSDGKTAFPRFPLFARCKVNQETRSVEFIMIVVHLKAFGDRQSQARRRLAAEKLLAIIADIRDHENLPVVLCGDFNEKLDTDVLSALKDTPDLFPLTADDATDGAISYVGTRFRSLIDHIIVSRDSALGDIAGDDAAIVRLDRSVSDFSDRISDHVPLVVRLIMRVAELPVQPTDRVDNDLITLEVPRGSNKIVLDFE